ncbi:hypothetical protein KIW84_051359 [Lathyrus oleraceus]|uniref:Ubiquitin-like protease family profile domain-containing protein n=1 Tax=Pisum sativum TaxID=3888 RepID=A0A9D4WNX8_PEA|nr:hypothetical protein KIW84_051359 [Pisum sativum]
MREMEDKMANQDDTHDANGSRNNVEKEIKRGLTVMKSIIRARDKGVKFEVHWSAEDQLIEPNGSTLASYIGFLVRQHIPITCDNWRSPELKVGKEKIWSEIQRSFHIDESRQKYCIQLAGKRLRGFRSFLSNKFLKDEEGKFVEAERPMKRIESVSSQKEVPGRKLKKAGNDIPPTTSGTKSQIMMRLEKMVEESDIIHGAIRSVDFDEGVFGFAHSEIIAKEDMQQLFEHEELGIAVIHTYIWYMYVTLMRGTELCNRFNFIAASRINTTLITKNPTSVKNELVDRFMAAGDNTTPSLYFLPFNSGNGGHWVLVAMDLSRLMVYYLDSLSGDWSKYPSMKKTVDAYLRDTTSVRLYFGGDKPTLVRYSGSDMDGDIDSIKSTSSYMIKFGACKELLWLKKFLQELGFVQDKYVLFVDSQSIIHLGKNLTFHNRFKHIDVRYHWICDVLYAKLLELSKVHTGDNVSDMTAKALSRGKFEACCDIAGLAISSS